MSIGKKILQARRELNLTQKELAQKIGLPGSTIARWETDSFSPSPKNIEKLSKALGREYKYFYETQEDIFTVFKKAKGEIRDNENIFSFHSDETKNEIKFAGVFKKGAAIFFEDDDISNSKNKTIPPQKLFFNVKDNSLSPDFEKTDTLEIITTKEIEPEYNGKYYIVEIKDEQLIYKCTVLGNDINLSIAGKTKRIPKNKVEILGRVTAVKKLL
ncbi:SOS-response transcriptional repressors (RecA-mediated autopeptidases) [Elusimicrobium minutum Pei191]|uniref:SOS-response transcriptional repressors (RecA-mediated autopeptidases) n=1 Tax=Elusimicrobium minutum (strain Pei191) TaxID=445932 RepID=B2KBJ0_ELUMP|nr:LexA family transcriptional regulator [Elusimicrobium minutum]ACC98012.1 SOS-response transcriptional repressors (RecA-mediated autopeptidases) [Elusimicrobium minutum Pei191]